MLTARMTSIGTLRVGDAACVPTPASLTLCCPAIPSEPPAAEIATTLLAAHFRRKKTADTPPGDIIPASIPVEDEHEKRGTGAAPTGREYGSLIEYPADAPASAGDEAATLTLEDESAAVDHKLSIT